MLITFGLTGPLAIHVLVPTLPELQRDFGATYTTTQLLISLFVVTFGLGQLMIGPLADLFGRRRVLVGGLSAFVATSVLCALAGSIGFLVVMRVLQGVCACTGIVIARAMVRDHFDELQSTRMLGYLSMGMALGPILAPVLGGLLFELAGWRGLFWMMAAMAALAVVLGLRFIDASAGLRPSGSGFGQLLRDIALLRRNRAFLLQAAGVCCNAGVFYAFVVGAPFVSSEFLGLAPAGYGLWFASVAFGYACGNFVAGRLTHRFSSEAMVRYAAVATVVLTLWLVFVLAAELYSRLLLFGSMVVIAFASGLLMPNAVSGALAACPGVVGSASGLIGASQYASAAVVTSLMSLLIDRWQHPVAMPLLMLAIALLGVLAAFAPRPRHGTLSS